MENKFAPYTEEEFKLIKQNIQSISDYIPENLLTFVWDNYKKLSNSTEGRPCTCGSAAKHWAKAVNVIRDFVSEVEKK